MFLLSTLVASAVWASTDGHTTDGTGASLVQPQPFQDYATWKGKCQLPATYFPFTYWDTEDDVCRELCEMKEGCLGFQSDVSGSSCKILKVALDGVASIDEGDYHCHIRKSGASDGSYETPTPSGAPSQAPTSAPVAPKAQRQPFADYEVWKGECVSAVNPYKILRVVDEEWPASESKCRQMCEDFPGCTGFYYMPSMQNCNTYNEALDGPNSDLSYLEFYPNWEIFCYVRNEPVPMPPTPLPTLAPSMSPTKSLSPTTSPSKAPSMSPTKSLSPTTSPTMEPTKSPTTEPTWKPTVEPWTSSKEESSEELDSGAAAGLIALYIFVCVTICCCGMCWIYLCAAGVVVGCCVCCQKTTDGQDDTGRAQEV